MRRSKDAIGLLPRCWTAKWQELAATECRLGVDLRQVQESTVEHAAARPSHESGLCRGFQKCSNLIVETCALQKACEAEGLSWPRQCMQRTRRSWVACFSWSFAWTWFTSGSRAQTIRSRICKRNCSRSRPSSCSAEAICECQHVR